MIIKVPNNTRVAIPEAMGSQEMWVYGRQPLGVSPLVSFIPKWKNDTTGLERFSATPHATGVTKLIFKQTVETLEANFDKDEILFVTDPAAQEMCKLLQTEINRGAIQTNDLLGAFIGLHQKKLEKMGVVWLIDPSNVNSLRIECINKKKAELKLQGIRCFQDKYKGKSLIVAGSGTSLNSVKHLIKSTENVKVLAINGALKCLLPEQVDFFFTLDWLGKDEWYKDYLITDNIKAIVMAGTPSVNKFFPKKNIHYWECPTSIPYRPFSKVISEITGGLLPGICGTYTALYFAWYCGFSSVAFVGQDFSIALDGSYHWNDKFNPNPENAPKENLVTYWHNDKPYLTTNIMLQNKEIIENTVLFNTETDKGKIDFVNCSGEQSILNIPQKRTLEDFYRVYDIPANAKGSPVTNR